jgi:arsenite methyltransferase
MAMHHLLDTDHLHRCFEAIERVMAPGARMFISDFGRLKSLKSVEYFVRRAVPKNEPILECDYRASLRAAFSREEFSSALSHRMKQRISIYATVVSPMMLVLMAPFPESSRHDTAHAYPVHTTLPANRLSDYRQLRLSLRLGGMPVK